MYRGINSNGMHKMFVFGGDDGGFREENGGVL